MAGPWEKYQPQQAPSGPWAKYQPAPAPQAAPAAPQESIGDYLRRELSPANLASAAVRPVVKAATAVPGIFADAGMAAWNLATGQNNQMPSAAANAVLDSVTRKPEGYGKGAEFVSSVLLGSRIPNPQIGASGPGAVVSNASQVAPSAYSQAPQGFVRPPTQVQQAFQNARGNGYVVPPSTVSPTVGTRLVETLGGKEGTAQDASIVNQAITNRLARQSVGVAEGATLDRATLNTIRQGASGAYESIRSAGTLTADPRYTAELNAVTARFRGAAKDFPDLAKTDINDIVKSVQKETFDADSAIDAISILRDKASTAYAQGDKVLGKAYRSISDAMEGVIERNLASRGEDAAGLLRAFREARQLIAKTYSVEKALNETTGNVAAQKLGQQLTRGAPLSGELRAAAQFGQAFPRAAREVVDSGSVRNTDAIVSGITSGLSGQPWYLLYPFARMGARNALLSDTVQNSLVRQLPNGSPGFVMGSAPALNELNALAR